MADNSFKGTVESLFKGVDGMISSKTVVGDAIQMGVTTTRSFGLGAGAFSVEQKERGGGGIGGKITPCAVLVIQNGNTKLVNIKNQDTITKILDMVPDVVDKFTKNSEEEETEQEVSDILDSDL